MRNNIGKAITIFVFLIVLLLVSSTAIGFFLYNQERQSRKLVEHELEACQNVVGKLQAELKSVRHDLVVSEDKAKEADEKINNLLDEIELNEGVRKELNVANATLRETVEVAKKEKEKVDAALEEAQKKYKVIQDLFKAEQDKGHDLLGTLKELEQAKLTAEAEIRSLKADLKPYDQPSPQDQIGSEVIPPGDRKLGKIQLDKIVVNPNDGVRGRVLSVDKQAEFVVCSLGLKQGLKVADIVSVYRGSEYLGDLRVSRVQEELSAADIIPPFSSHKIRKNDVVVFKP